MSSDSGPASAQTLPAVPAVPPRPPTLVLLSIDAVYFDPEPRDGSRYQEEREFLTKELHRKFLQHRSNRWRLVRIHDKQLHVVRKWVPADERSYLLAYESPDKVNLRELRKSIDSLLDPFVALCRHRSYPSEQHICFLEFTLYNVTENRKCCAVWFPRND